MRRTLTLLVSISCWMAPQLAAQAQSLQLISTTTPASPQGPVDAVAAPNRLYVADFAQSALRIYDTSQPAALQLLGSLTGILRPNGVIVNGTKVYLSSRAIGAASDSWLYAVDVSNGAAPSIIRRATLPPNFPRMVATSTLMCAAVSPTVYVFDSNLNSLSTITSGVDGIALNNNYLYVLAGSWLDTYDLSAPATPVKVSSVAVGSYPNTSNSPSVLAFANNTLYISGYAGVFTLSNPAVPKLVAANAFYFNKASGSTAYRMVTGVDDVITVVDLRVPTAPVVAASTVAFTSYTYDLTDAVTGQDDLVYAVKSLQGQIKTYRYTAGVLATRSSAPLAFTLYPNPATDEVTLALPTAAVAGQRVALRDACGRLVLEQALPVGSTRATLHLAALRAGLYFVQSGATTQKLVRQ